MDYQSNKSNIKIKDLSVIYNKGQSNEVVSLSNVNVEIYPNEYLIIFGPSGCGKSTLLYSISGLQRPTEGTVEIDGKDINKLPRKEQVEFHRSKIGMIFQAFYLIPSISILDNVCLPKVFSSRPDEETKAAAITLLNRFGIDQQANKFPSELSGGQKQRVSIARSLMNNPQIILADEPVGNLDSKSSQNVMAILSELNEIDKKTVILVTHDPNHLHYGDRVIHMKDGKIVREEIIRDKRPPEMKKTAGEVGSGTMVEDNTSQSLKMLMRTFQSISSQQAETLLASFKAQQLLAHVFFDSTDEQLTAVKKELEKVIVKKTVQNKFKEFLDLDFEKGGAGWDKRSAVQLAEKMEVIINQAARVSKLTTEKAAKDLSVYFSRKYQLGTNSKKINLTEKLFAMRLKNEIDGEQVRQKLDLPVAKGGAGLDRRMARKISREMEIILLLNYLK